MLSKIPTGRPKLRDWNWFRSLPTEQVAQIVAQDKKRVCVFPINGTRRWYLLEHYGKNPSREADYLRDYVDQSAQNHRQLYRLLFEHGIHTLLTSLFGSSLLERSETWVASVMGYGLALLDRDPAFRQLYQEMGVRVRFYGDYRRALPDLGFGHLIELLDRIAYDTRHNDRHLLLYGVCADDAVATIAQLSVQYYLEHGRPPDKRTLVELYYGEHVEPVDLFIGFDKLCTFDMPLLATGNEDLYFTVSPSPYLTAEQLRAILYDHLYSRRMPETDYTTLSPDDLKTMKEFYDLNRQNVLGVGRRSRRGDFWYPLPEVHLTLSLEE